MSFIDKLKLRKEIPVIVLNDAAVSAGAFNNYEVKYSLLGKTPIQQIVFFAKDKKTLDEKVENIISRLADDALFWIAYPKKSGSIKTDITRDIGWEKLIAAGYDGVTQVAIDSDWSALRFRKKENISGYIRKVPLNERKTEGVDYLNRKVMLPDDVANAMREHKGLEAFFKSYAFSHQKEHIVYIVEAKKPETRARRIDKTIETLLKAKEEKSK